MKTNFKLFVAIALMATACSTGSKVTSGGYADDLYYTPGDAPHVAPKPVKEVKQQPQQKSMVAMQVEENEKGKTVNNYIVPKSSRKDKNAYYFDDQPAYADTVLEYKDDKEQVTVNNYFEGEEMDYSSRIRPSTIHISMTHSGILSGILTTAILMVVLALVRMVAGIPVGVGVVVGTTPGIHGMVDMDMAVLA